MFDRIEFDDLRQRTIAAVAADGYDPALLEIGDDRSGRAALLLLATLSAMRGLPNKAKTLAAIRTRSAEIAAAWGPPSTAVEPQHVGRDGRLDAIYQHARFPGRAKAARGLRSASPEELIRTANAALAEAASLKADVERLSAEVMAARVTSAVEIVREFARRYELVLSLDDDQPNAGAEAEAAGTFRPSPVARRKAEERAVAKAGRKQKLGT